MIRKLLDAVRRLTRSKKPPTPVSDEMVRRATARATSDMWTKQGGVETKSSKGVAPAPQ